MLRPDRSIDQVYLHRAPVDMRKQIDGLVILTKDVIQQDPTSGALFAFINTRRNKLKLLIWERNGFVIWYTALWLPSRKLARCEPTRGQMLPFPQCPRACARSGNAPKRLR
jgi:transposase